MTVQTKENYFLSQPHQPFFILGVANAIIAMLIFALSYKGIFSLHVATLNFHVYTLVFLLFSNVFTGFLFTTFPRFNQSDTIAKNYYTNIFYANAIGSILFFLGAFVNHYILMLAMLILFISQVYIVLELQKIYKTGVAPDKKDSFWILTAFKFGLVGHLLFILTEVNNHVGLEISLLNNAIHISFYMFAIFLAFSVAQRMIPFFSHSFAVKNENFVKIIFVLFLLRSLVGSLELQGGIIILDLLLGAYMLMEFLRWELRPFESPAILWVLHLSLFWLPTAFLLSALSTTVEMFTNTSFYFLEIHLLAIGFLTTVLIGFGTRVTLGHSGQPPHGDDIATKIFWLIQVVVILRALYSVNVAFGWGLNFLFDISFSAWLVLFIFWGARYGKVLVFGSKLN